MTTILDTNLDNVLENLCKDKTLFKTSNDEPTPLELCTEMIKYIPDMWWAKKRNSFKILDPCTGFGNFMICIFRQLQKDYNTKTILENIFHFNEINEDRLSYLKSIFMNDQFNLNITNIDFLKYPEDTLYDLQMVNPPFAKFHEVIEGDKVILKRSSKNHTLIREFIKKSLDLCKDGGIIAYIVPNNWMSLADRNTLITELTKYQFHKLAIQTPKKYFPKIGSSFTYFILEKTPFYQNYPVDCLFNKQTYSTVVKSSVRDFIPLLYTSHTQSILEKVLGGESKFNILTSSDLHRYTKKKLIQNHIDDTFKFKLHHTDKQTVWANRPHKFQDGWKVFINLTGKWNIFIDNCGMTQSIAFIVCNNKREASKIYNTLNKPVYRFVSDMCRWGNFNNIRILQRLSYDFKLSEEEILFMDENCR